ncbi:MAG: HD domain-containing protein [Spirochaetales bacterium]|jgi:uncharacterized protein|nr:HD domain-containing protein [Spirochaetales bacterium]
MPAEALSHSSIRHKNSLAPATSNQLRAIAATYCDADGGCHGPDHALRVEKTALYIGKHMDCRLDIIAAGAILHDIGRRAETACKGTLCHAIRGAELAKPILQEFNFNTTDIDAICDTIRCHRYRGSLIPPTIEAKILFDADKLDSIGAIGIGRAFLFAGEIGAKLHNNDQNIIGSKSYTTEDTAYREFKVKMCKIKDRMFTPIGRQLALERHAFMEIFFKRLDKEFFGS